MTTATNRNTKNLLSPNQRTLLELMQSINFGRIEGLTIRSGQPVYDPRPAVIREIKIGGENGPRRELDRDNFVLRERIIELFDHLEHLGNGQVRCLEVKHGLPFKLTVEGSG